MRRPHSISQHQIPRPLLPQLQGLTQSQWTWRPTTTATIIVAPDAVGNTDVIYTSGLQLNGAVAGTTSKREQNTDSGLLLLGATDAITLALEDAFPSLLVPTTAKDQLSAWPVHRTLSLEQWLDLPDAPPKIICSAPVRKPRIVSHTYKPAPPLRDCAMGSVWCKRQRKKILQANRESCAVLTTELIRLWIKLESCLCVARLFDDKNLFQREQKESMRCSTVTSLSRVTSKARREVKPGAK